MSLTTVDFFLSQSANQTTKLYTFSPIFVTITQNFDKLENFGVKFEENLGLKYEKNQITKLNTFSPIFLTITQFFLTN